MPGAKPSYPLEKRILWCQSVDKCHRTVKETCPIFGISQKNYYHWRYLAISALSLFLSGCVLTPPTDMNQANWRDIKIGEVPLKIELALTTEEQFKGLSGRDSLAPGTGMLFKFTKADKYTFWMKDMKFALDFIWLQRGKVVQLSSDVPPPLADFPRPEILSASEPVDVVIEVPAGWIRKHGIRLGDVMDGL